MKFDFDGDRVISSSDLQAAMNSLGYDIDLDEA